MKTVSVLHEGILKCGTIFHILLFVDDQVLSSDSGNYVQRDLYTFYHTTKQFGTGLY